MSQLVILPFELLSLIKDAEGIILDGVLAFFDNLTTIEALPSLKVDKMIEK
jgi:hypothetical protein